MSERITPVRRPRGRAATKLHHRKPSHDVAIRAFASKAGRGKALLEYAAEQIKAGRIVSVEDLQRAVDSGAFGRWLDNRATNRKVVSRVIVAEGVNPNWKPAPPTPQERSAQEIGDEFRAAINDSNNLREKFALERDRDEALAFCIQNRCPNDFADILNRMTAARHIRETLASRRK